MPDELLGLGVRIALREAVGGWGPYSVREIHDLFNSYGFLDRDAEDGYEGGERRSAADAYQARIDFSSYEQVTRYLDLISEVLENYPEGQEEGPAGRRLRRQLRQAGVVADSEGRLHLANADAQAAATLELATDGVWTPDRLRLFVSHTSHHREIVGRLAENLNHMGLSCFVAHDAIEPSRDWQQVIETALSTCDALLAIVTPDFHASKWTDQEVGWALGRGALIVPVRAGADPYGFFGTFQALPMSAEDALYPSKVAVEVIRALSTAIYRVQRPRATKLGKAMVSVIVETFCNSPNFDSTRQRFPLLKLIPTELWTDGELDRLEAAASSNRQIEQAVLLPGGPVPEALSRFTSEIRSAVR